MAKKTTCCIFILKIIYGYSPTKEQNHSTRKYVNRYLYFVFLNSKILKKNIYIFKKYYIAPAEKKKVK